MTIPEDSSPGSSPAPLPASPAPLAQRPTQRWMILSLVIIGMVAGASVVMLLKSAPHDVSAATPTSAGPDAVSVRAAASAAVTFTPKWSGGVRRSNGRYVAVYELEADNDIAVWGKIVRPVLTIRCIAGTTEVFVLTQSAAAIDGDDGKHAVRVGYDAEPDGSERWLASDEYDALFAENGVSAARRIAGAHAMRFAFTPYNAAPVVARFQVAGFDAVVPRLAQACRWK
jgi:hypothetical protein